MTETAESAETTVVKLPDGNTVPLSDLYATVDAAAYLGVSRITLWRWVQAGKISTVPSDRHILFLRSDMDKLLSTRGVEG